MSKINKNLIHRNSSKFTEITEHILFCQWFQKSHDLPDKFKLMHHRYSIPENIIINNIILCV